MWRNFVSMNHNNFITHKCHFQGVPDEYNNTYVPIELENKVTVFHCTGEDHLVKYLLHQCLSHPVFFFQLFTFLFIPHINEILQEEHEMTLTHGTGAILDLLNVWVELFTYYRIYTNVKCRYVFWHINIRTFMGKPMKNVIEESAVTPKYRFSVKV